MSVEHQRSMPGEHSDTVSEAIERAGPNGTDLFELEASTGIRKRVLENVVWHLENQGRAYRLASRPRLRYVAKHWRPTP